MSMDFMKYLNRIEIMEFIKRYFPAYIGDIRSVSYFDYNGKREFLINNPSTPFESCKTSIVTISFFNNIQRYYTTINNK